MSDPPSQLLRGNGETGLVAAGVETLDTPVLSGPRSFKTECVQVLEWLESGGKCPLGPTFQHRPLEGLACGFEEYSENPSNIYLRLHQHLGKHLKQRPGKSTGPPGFQAVGFLMESRSRPDLLLW